MTTGSVIFRLDISHAVIDAVSRSILFHEWSLIYTDQLPDQVAPSYCNYVRHLLNTSDSATRYWVEYLQDSQPCLFPVSATPGNERGSLKNIVISVDDTPDLHSICQKHGFTIPTLVKSVWALMLSSWMDKSSVYFGYLDSGRHTPIPDIQETVGALLNILICRARLDEHASLSNILETMQEDYYQSLSHSSGTLRALKMLGLTPPSQHIFNTLINYRKTGLSSTPEQTGLVFDSISAEDKMEFDAVLQVDEIGKELGLSIDYWDARIPETVARQIAGLFKIIWTRLLEDPSQQVLVVQQAMRTMV
ncbi:hypothetical protein AWENTII_000352 [Aspergillus wentii]